MNEKSSIGSRIAELRKLHGYTQGEFADMLDVTAQAVSKWENDVSCPDISILPKISEILEITLDELITGKKSSIAKSNKTANSQNINMDKLKLVINVFKPHQKPVKVSLPMPIVKKIAKIGNGISGIVGQNAISEEMMEQIMQLIDEGITGTIIDVIAEDNTNVVVEIK
mgnify:CR=1 FL=1